MLGIIMITLCLLGQRLLSTILSNEINFTLFDVDFLEVSSNDISKHFQMLSGSSEKIDL